MKSLFTYFGASFTPFFLQKYSKHLTIGKSIGYYFFWGCIVSIILTIAVVMAAWHFSTFEKMSSYLDKVPAFEFVFEDNILVKTSFSEDPYIIKFEDKQIGYISSSRSVADMNIGELQPGVYVLRDGLIPVEVGKKIQAVLYKDTEIGDKVVNNIFMKDIVQEFYPVVRPQIIFVFVPIVTMMMLGMTAIVHFITIFIWAGILRLICCVRGLPQLAYDQLVAFTFYTHFFDIISTVIILSLAGIWFSGWTHFIIGTLISFIIFFSNLWFLRKNSAIEDNV